MYRNYKDSLSSEMSSSSVGTLPPYHAESAAVLNMMAQMNLPPLHLLGSVELARQTYHALATGPAGGNYQFDGTRTEKFVPIPDSSDTIPVYVYTPSNVASDPLLFIFFHGGGMAIGSRITVEKTCQQLAYDARCIVVNVEYRLAPEHRFPTALDDGCTVARWVLANKTLVGGTESSKVGVGGDSAGGTISATVAHEVPGLACQVLVYPKVTELGPSSLKSYEEYKNDPSLSAELMQWFTDQSTGPENYNDVRWASIKRPSFDKLPPALFIVAQCDPLRDDSYEYEKKLREAGVPVEIYLMDGAIHGFYTIPGAFPTLTKEAYGKTANFLKKWG